MVKGEAPFDIWSLVHLSSGFALAFVGFSPLVAVCGIIGYEFVEAGLRLIPNGQGGVFEYESFGNMVADVAVGIIGYFAGELVRRRFAIRRLFSWRREPSP